MTPQVFPLANGAQLGYEILGADHLKRGVRPIVLINGMSGRYEDWETLSIPLSKLRPVLVFDHRDFGASIVKTSKREEITTLSMAEDAIALIDHLRFRGIDACGGSMGGVILQQILILASTTPSAVPFRIHHALLAATTTKIPRGDPEFIEYLAKPPPVDGQLTEERKMTIARPMVELGYDVDFLRTPEGKAKVEKLLPSMILKRPSKQIARQALSVRNTDTRPLLPSIPSSIPILVIHGTKDRIIHYAESNYLTRHIKHAQRIAIDPSGKVPGSVPSEAYGHSWCEYFEPRIWVNVVQTFTKGGVEEERVKL
ncbi:Alpha/Beta hydrolase protein [Cantharellus anzutake]|uniref:Alpha/Beta hydrolase protein n=1 Tax=Cantharellus anzutake TaxID=1750568 RepID=UPI0019076F5E|nr:Alpha/Beta hydrolase protein [Cantharellus anzutake]KAF8310432.1 Alpha/Beta hydrolase protein [Cantharellus anzutake]